MIPAVRPTWWARTPTSGTSSGSPWAIDAHGGHVFTRSTARASSRDQRAQARAIGDHDAAGGALGDARACQRAHALVHALARRVHHVAELLLRELDAEDHALGVDVRADAVGELVELFGDARRHRQRSVVVHALGQASDAARHGLEQALSDAV